MDFVNKAYAQTVELVRSMSPGTRAATALLLVVIVVSLVFLFQFQGQGGDEFLLGGRPFSASEVTAIEAAFAQAGLGGSTLVENRIRIPRGQKNAYLAAMADAGALPADFYKYLDEATLGDNPFATSKSQELRRAGAKMKELALIVSRMNGIETATVQYDEEARPGLARTKQKTAMVAVWTTGGALEEDQVKAIRNIVSSAYAGLDRQSITITDMTNSVSYGASPGPGGASESESIYANHKLKYERDWQRKIADQLKMIAGAVVNVNVEMNPEILDRSQSVKIDPKPVTVTSQEFTKESTTTAPGTAGRPGAVPNGVESPGNRAIAVSQPTSTGPESTTSESRSQVQNLPGQEQLYKELAPLVPKKVTAAIDLPWSYYVKVWRERNPTPAGQPPKQPDPLELTRIETETKELVKEKVRNLLPPVIAGTDPYPHITVSTYTDLASPAPVTPSIVAASGTWLADNWRTLALVGLGCFSLLMLRSMVRSPAAAPSPAPAAAHPTASSQRPPVAHEADDEEPEPAAVLRKRFESSGPDLKAELRDLVKENPDAAANVLRMWIGDAA
jgi:flagellar M-ring protein FliF